MSVNSEKQGQSSAPSESRTLGQSRELVCGERPDEVLVWLENGASEKASVGGNKLIPNWCGADRPTCTRMKLLLVHQNFPGQFRDLGPAL